ncbi:MAG: DapH/DapD/GlmU-related protein [Christensenellales bacterium]
MTIKDSNSVFIDPQAVVADDVVIYPDNHIIGKCVIGEHSVLMPGNIIEDCVIGEGCTITKSVLKQSTIGDGTTVGPFSYLRPGSQIGKGCRIGDFVEVKNAVIGDGTKVSHLTYVGDCTIGKRCNVGCGVVFVNYNGVYKSHSEVGDDCFIGSNTNVIAPVKVQDNSYIACGTTLSQDVPTDSLVIGRSRAIIKEGRASLLLGKYTAEKLAKQSHSNDKKKMED